MKKLLLTTLLTSTMMFASAPDSTGNWTETFNTTAGPIEHTPNHTRYGFITAGKGLNMSAGSSINGFVFPGNLSLETDSTRAVFVAALKAAGIYNGE